MVLKKRLNTVTRKSRTASERGGEKGDFTADNKNAVEKSRDFHEEKRASSSAKGQDRRHPTKLLEASEEETLRKGKVLSRKEGATRDLPFFKGERRHLAEQEPSRKPFSLTNRAAEKVRR